MIRTIWNTMTTLVVGIVVILTILLVGVKLAGLDIFTVLSGSMEPAYKTGSVIYVKETDEKDLMIGDVITFYLDDHTIATHRIVRLTEINGELAFFTKGDANEVEDAVAVPSGRVVGKVVLTIPYLGYWVTYLQSHSGRYATIAAGAVLLLLMLLPDVIFSEEKKKTVSENGSKENVE